MNPEILPMLVEGDLTVELAHELEIRAKENGLAIDIETSGLSPANDSIEVVSLSAGDRPVIVTVSRDVRPHYVAGLLENESLKILHHALFDASFFRARWDVVISSVFCTKVAARIAGIARNPTLEYLVHQVVGVELDKSERVSNWRQRPLTESQIRYASRDVAFLHRLQQELSWKLSDVGRTLLFDACMRYLPARVELGLLGLDDVFRYELPE